jgi:hypothetical protein
MGRAQCCDTIERFAERYRVVPNDAARLIEQAVIGGDWGANGYTTIGQADRLATELGLEPESVLADIGCGRGWPGLYLAARTGCQVVLSDVPKERCELPNAGLGAKRWNPGRPWYVPVPFSCPSRPGRSMPSCTRTCCVVCGRS